MISREVLARVRQIEIRTRKWVNAVFSGEYESHFKGRGMEFDEVRPYQTGDDVRTIDWNVTARTGSLHVKKFVEERELTVMLLVDMSSSGSFGTRRQLKVGLAVEIAALLAFSAIRNNDRVGMIIFTSEVECFIPPKKGRSHVLRLIRDLIMFSPRKTRTGLSEVLEYLNKAVKKRAVVFLISDFLAESYEKSLGVTNRRHDLVALQISDPAEERLPAVGPVNLEDAESGEMLTVDTGERRFRSLFAGRTSVWLRERERIFNALDIDRVRFSTEWDHVIPLIRFFKQRSKRGR